MTRAFGAYLNMLGQFNRPVLYNVTVRCALSSRLKTLARELRLYRLIQTSVKRMRLRSKIENFLADHVLHMR